LFNNFKRPVKGLENFAKFNFVLPDTLANKQAMVTIKGSAKVNLAKATVAITDMAGGSKLKKGNSVTLISKVTGKPSAIKATGVKMGATKLYDFTVAVSGVKLIATVKNVRANKKIGSTTLGTQIGLTALNQATDSLTGALAGAAAAGRSTGGPTFFGTASGGQSLAYNLNTSQEVWQRPGRAEADTMTTGLAWSTQTRGGGLVMVGAFMEKGRNDFNSPLGYNHLASVSGGLENDMGLTGLHGPEGRR